MEKCKEVAGVFQASDITAVVCRKDAPDACLLWL